MAGSVVASTTASAGASSDLLRTLWPDVRLSIRGAGPGEGGRDRGPPLTRLRPRSRFSKSRRSIILSGRGGLNPSDGPPILRVVRRVTLLVAVGLALLVAGGASAYVLRTIWLRPGHCTKLHGTKVCARKVKPRTVSQTVTVGPSPIGATFSGNGDKTLAPLTLAHG